MNESKRGDREQCRTCNGVNKGRKKVRKRGIDSAGNETTVDVRMHACGDAQETQCRGGHEGQCIMVWETKLHGVANDGSVTQLSIIAEKHGPQRGS